MSLIPAHVYTPKKQPKKTNNNCLRVSFVVCINVGPGPLSYHGAALWMDGPESKLPQDAGRGWRWGKVSCQPCSTDVV